MYVDTLPFMTGAASVFPYSPELEKAFEFITNFGDKANMSLKKGQSLYVPRELVQVSTHDMRTYWVNPPAIDCNFTPVNDEQEPLIALSVQLLKGGRNHVFNAPTGWGKSIAGSVVACRMGQPTMICVQKEDLMDSWVDALTKLGVPSNMIGKVQADTCVWEGKQFVIGMVQSLIIPDRYPAEMYRYFGLLILDEVHLMAATQFVNVCWKFPARYRLGFSATPDRADGKWKVVEAHVGQVLVKGTLVPMAPKILVKKTGWSIPSRQKYDDKKGQMVTVKIPHAPGSMMLVTKAMISSQPRNMIITEFAKSTYKAERVLLVLSDMKDHLDRLFQMMTASGIPGDQIGYYVGGMKKIELEHTKKKKIVLATYQMCSTGTNVPHWDSLVMATPRSNVKQSVGRVIRYVEGKNKPVILDLVDHDKIFSSFHYSRRSQYHALGAEIITL
jgi:superfamily II DNA or RNA helicase